MNSINCPTEDVLLDYTAGQLDPTQAALFEKHADGCMHCAALRTAQAAIWQRMDEWKPEPVSAGFNRELWRRIDAEAQSPSWRQRLAGFSLWQRIAPVAVAMAVIVTGYLLDHSTVKPGPVQTGSKAAIVVTVSDADQLEQTLDDMQLLHQVNAAAAAAKADSKVM